MECLLGMPNNEPAAEGEIANLNEPPDGEEAEEEDAEELDDDEDLDEEDEEGRPKNESIAWESRLLAQVSLLPTTNG